MLLTVQIHCERKRIHIRAPVSSDADWYWLWLMFPSTRPKMKTQRSLDSSLYSHVLVPAHTTEMNMNKENKLTFFRLTSSYSFLLSACRIMDLDSSGDIKYTQKSVTASLPCWNIYARFAWRWCDLETVTPVLTIHGHNGAVVQVQHHAPRHRPPRLAHEVPPLGEEEQSVPGRGH